MKDETWRESAACGTGRYSPDLWYPADGAFDDRTKAKRICITECPVRDLCLAYGINEDFGIWGGLTGRERRALERESRLISADGTRRRLQALACRGWGPDQIASLTRRDIPGATSSNNLRLIRCGMSTSVRAGTAASIQAVYVDLCRWDSTTTYAARTRALAERNFWPGPERWVGVDIDNPKASPRRAEKAA